MRYVITSSWTVLAVAGVLSIGSALAQEGAAAAVKSTPPNSSAQAPSQQAALPTCLEKLNLTAQQQTQIQEIVGDYEVDVASVWKQFSVRYLETIRTEALLLSAIEDNLTEPQRAQVRDQRRRVARHEKTLAGARAPAPPTTPKPVSAVEEEITIMGVPLTPDQEAAADAVQEKYLSRLRSLNRAIEGLHNRLVSLEADKFVEIEKVLTEDQLKQLCQIRQTAPPALLGEVTSKRDALQAR